MNRTWLGLSLCALAACGGATEDELATANPRFDWLDYSGNDSVYRTITPTADQYVNPVLAGFYPDPSITRVGEDYYLVNSTFVYFPGIPVHHSRDLVNWTQIGNVIDRPTQLDFDTLGISRGVFAPSINHHKGTFYVLNTCVDCGGNFYVTATNPAGPWSDPVWLKEIDGIDPSFFFDDDGKAYILNNGPPVGTPLYRGHRAIWIQEFDLATKKLVGDRTVLVNGGVDLSTKPIWIEGPHIFRRDGHYIMTAAEGGTAEGHSQVVLKSKNVRGPFVPFAGNPILTQRHLGERPFPVTSAGHAQLVETPSGEWWATFLATRPYTGDLYNIGRETFLLPVTWVGGWPIILPAKEVIPYVHTRPRLAADSAPRLPTHGNFSYRDEFNDTSLALHWLQIRTPKERSYDLTSQPGWLTLRARNADITRRGQPSFVGRRQQHLNADVSTSMRYRPAATGDKAGLIAFQNDDYNLFLAVTLDGGATVVRLERKAGSATPGDAEVVASAPLEISGSNPIYLRIVARGGLYDFYYGVKPDQWTLLKGDVDGSILSTKVAQGFVGTLFGLYAFTRGP
jgi:xylan 1,4-beta-xylosidase